MLYAAAHGGDPAVVQNLLEAGASLHVSSWQGHPYTCTHTSGCPQERARMPRLAAHAFVMPAALNAPQRTPSSCLIPAGRGVAALPSSHVGP